jgi:Fe-S cluster assembly protein SufD
MSSALNKPKYKMIIDNYYNQIATKKSLTSLNTALLLKGLYQHTKSKVADKPVEIMYFSTGSEAALMVQPRNLVIVGENSLKLLNATKA